MPQLGVPLILPKGENESPKEFSYLPTFTKCAPASASGKRDGPVYVVLSSVSQSRFTKNAAMPHRHGSQIGTKKNGFE